jgi:hypothetical protein
MDNTLSLQGPSGLIEAILSTPVESVSTIAIICHPHPLHGGTLQNKVVHTLMRAFRELQIASVRFNFRGVGKSEGAYDQGVGEVEDLMAVISWAKAKYPEATIWLAGFSFGAFVVAGSLVHINSKIAQLILVAPPIESFDFSEVDFSSTPTCVVIGEQDNVVDPSAVTHWVKQNPTIDLLVLPEADHFFHGQLTALKATLVAYLAKHK